LIPVYNGAAYVARAIESALAQTHEDVELLIVNDGSPDDSRRVIEPYLLSPKVRYIEKPNGGVASARNAGLRIATGAYVALLDQDDAWYPNKLARQVAVLERRPEVALVHADVDYVDAEGTLLAHDPYFPARVEGSCFREFFMANPVMACTAIARRTAIDEAGGFDEQIRFADDYDLWLRIAHRHAVAFIAEPLATYRVHDSNESRKTAGIVAAALQVLKKAMVSITDCEQLVGKKNVDARFAQLECSLSRHYFSNRQWVRFGVHWLRAMRQDPRTAVDLGLPPPVLDRLRWYSKKLSLR
jgi:glycosyltransferase involved in cell wall biosynthesis